MKLREFYENNGVDYDAFLQRLMGRESLAVKYIKVFLNDTTFGELANAVVQQDFDQIGKKSHSLKGIALNLDLKKLSTFCVEVTNSAYSADMQEVEAQFNLLEKEYKHIVSELRCLSLDLGV